MTIANATPAHVRKILSGHFDDDQVGTILDLLLRAGIISADSGASDRISAAKIHGQNQMENEARRTAARLGLTISASGRIDPDELSRAMNKNGYSIEARMRLRSMFGACSMIPA